MKRQKFYALALASAMVMPLAAKTNAIPLVYDQENTGAAFKAPEMKSMEESESIKTLPNPFEFSNSKKQVKKFQDWEKRRSEILAEIQHYELGVKPLPTDDLKMEASMEGSTLKIVLTRNGESLTITTTIQYPQTGTAPYPLLIGCDMCSFSRLLLERGVAYCSFTSTQVNKKEGGFPGSTGDFDRLYPEYTDGGGYAMTSWGVSRIIDALQELGVEKTNIDTKHLGVSGCSYAGKMALYAGVLDERIALTIPQEPGGGGVAAWRVSETLGKVENLGATNHNWFIKDHDKYAGENTQYLPFDQHELLALCCPRAVLVFGNNDFEWLAEPAGYVSCVAARKVWEKFGIEDRMGFSINDGHGHCQLPQVQYPELFAFVDRFLLGKEDVDTKDITYMKASKISINPSEWINWK